MNDNVTLAPPSKLVTEQAGRLLVSLGGLLRSLPELSEGGTKSGELLERIGGKLAKTKHNTTMQGKTGRLA